MFERFTERARQVVVLAQEEARLRKHAQIGTEHVLVGLLREEAGVAARVLESLGVSTERARAKLPLNGDVAVEGQIPFTVEAKKVLELSLREALSLGHNYIGTEHVLMGLLRLAEGSGFETLCELVDPKAAPTDVTERVRDEIIRMLSGPSCRRRRPAQPSQATATASFLPTEAQVNPPDGSPLTLEVLRTGMGRLTAKHKSYDGLFGRVTDWDWRTDLCELELLVPGMEGTIRVSREDLRVARRA